MDLEDIPQVLEVDRESYTLPWPASAYRREILHNRNARYYVLRDESESKGDGDASMDHTDSDQRSRHPFSFLRWPLRSPDGQQAKTGILGYAGMWLMMDESHITTIAMRTAWRGRGFGELLLMTLVDAARDLGVLRMTLEVRVSNEAAQRLYRKYGFEERGVRPRYYSDNNEDAHIMTTGDIQDAAYRDNFETRVSALRRRLLDGQDLTVSARAFEMPSQSESVSGAD
jgi:[ribosomal protein S18]-alanine N-acetyltransferase